MVSTLVRMSLQGYLLFLRRRIDDDAFKLSVAGGVTTALVLPGSANAIGGQAFPIKLRPTAERSPSSMVLEPPYSLNGSDLMYTRPPRWRHMKWDAFTYSTVSI